MRSMILFVLLFASSCYAQMPATTSGGQSAAPTQSASVPNGIITLPAGTIIPAKLVTQITAKARAGDPVRAVTSFPVTLGTQTVIPVGTYLDGVIERVNKRTPNVEMRFTQLLFANGYTVPVAGEESEPTAGNYHHLSNAFDAPADAPVDSGSGPYVDLAAAQEGPFPPQPQLPPLPRMHNHFGVAIGIAVGVMVGTLVAVILLRHYRGNGGPVLFDPGWQFQVVLKQPASIDAAKIESILAAPSGD